MQSFTNSSIEFYRMRLQTDSHAQCSFKCRKSPQHSTSPELVYSQIKLSPELLRRLRVHLLPIHQRCRTVCKSSAPTWRDEPQTAVYNAVTWEEKKKNGARFFCRREDVIRMNEWMNEGMDWWMEGWMQCKIMQSCAMNRQKWKKNLIWWVLEKKSLEMSSALHLKIWREAGSVESCVLLQRSSQKNTNQWEPV